MRLRLLACDDEGEARKPSSSSSSSSSSTLEGSSSSSSTAKLRLERGVVPRGPAAAEEEAIASAKAFESAAPGPSLDRLLGV